MLKAQLFLGNEDLMLCDENKKNQSINNFIQSMENKHLFGKTFWFICHNLNLQKMSMLCIVTSYHETQ